MSNRFAGKMDADFVAGCRTNEGPDSTLESWICEKFACESAEIDSENSVWITEIGGSGRWLADDEIKQFAEWVERQRV